LSTAKPGRILDAPAGTGILSVFLRDHEWDVSCLDIDEGNLVAQGFPFERANLNRDRIPYEDETFDAVVCANGLHRLFNPGNAIREFRRVLKPGGILYITVNNYASISKRLHFLIYGSITTSINLGNYLQTIDEPEANFRNHLFMPQLVNTLEREDFSIDDVRPEEVKSRHRLLLPLALLVRFIAMFSSAKKKRQNRNDYSNHLAVSSGGRYVYIEATKPPKA
jgi:SAM-dependent methyltransferase